MILICIMVFEPVMPVTGVYPHCGICAAFGRLFQEGGMVAKNKTHCRRIGSTLRRSRFRDAFSRLSEEKKEAEYLAVTRRSGPLLVHLVPARKT